jgi:pyruvate,orthophosphate dikinase
MPSSKKIRKILEKHYKDMMDIEFTIEQGKLYMLQCRVGKRTGLAAIKIALDMKDERLINEKEALLRIEPEQLNQLLRPIFDAKQKREAIDKGRMVAKGLNAGPGAATGRIYFNAADAEAAAKRGERVILVRIETSPEDIRGMAAAEGILTARGGMTSHAALVAAKWAKSVSPAAKTWNQLRRSSHENQRKRIGVQRRRFSPPLMVQLVKSLKANSDQTFRSLASLV